MLIALSQRFRSAGRNVTAAGEYTTNRAIDGFGAIGNAVIYSYKTLTIMFKTLVVNYVPIDVFLWGAKYMPIGGWLEYEKPNQYGEYAIDIALQEKNKGRMRAILGIASDEVIEKYFLERPYLTGVGTELLPKASFDCNYDYDSEHLQILLEGIKPEKRLFLFNRNMYVGQPYLCRFATANLETINLVMNSLPERDRFEAINVADQNGDTPLFHQVSYGVEVNQIEAILKHCPKEHLFDYLSRINKEGRTPLMLLVQKRENSEEIFKYILNLIPKDRRIAFLGCHGQGKKLMELAHVDGEEEIKRILHKNEIPYVANLPKITKKNAGEQRRTVLDRWVMSYELNDAKEGFKMEHHAYPLSILGIEKVECEFSEIRKAYLNLMKINHSDHNSNENAHDVTAKITCAYHFYAKPENQQEYSRKYKLKQKA